MSNAKYAAICWIAIAAIAAGIFFRCYQIDRKTVWGDEITGAMRTLGYTEAEIVHAGPSIRTAADIRAYFELADAAHGGPRPLLATVNSLLDEDPQHPPLYYMLVRIFENLAGTSTTALRILPVFFGILSIPALAWLAFELFASRRVALIAASLYAISPFAVLYSQEAREYALWCFEILLSSACLLRAARTGEKKYWLGYSISTALGLYTYPFTVLVGLAHAATIVLVAAYRKREVWVPFLVAGTCAVLCFLPWPIAAIRGMHSGLIGLNGLLALKLPLLTVAVVFFRDLKTFVIDLGYVEGHAARLALTASGFAFLALLGYSMFHLLRRDSKIVPRVFLISLFLCASLPLLAHDVISGGALVSQIRYFLPSFLVIPLAFAWLFHIKIDENKAMGLRASAWTSIYVLTLLAGALSCAISSQASTWYNKAYERTPEVAAIINGTPNSMVMQDKKMARLLELGYYLNRDIGVAGNLTCEVCSVEPPPPRDLFKDAAGFQHIFVVDPFPGAIPPGAYTVEHMGGKINPPTSGPLDLFALYPH